MAKKIHPNSLKNLEKGRTNIQDMPNANHGRYKSIFRIAKEQDFSQQDVICLFKDLYSRSQAELNLIMADPDAPAIKKTVCAAILRDIEDGTFKALDSLLDRGWGKPRQTTEIEGGLNLTPPPIIIEGEDE